jgi:UDP-glucuronate 4-epimerase
VKILVTGVAGFIGYHLAKRLAAQAGDTSDTIVGIDNINDYYDVELKHGRLKDLGNAITFYKMDVADNAALQSLFKAERFDIVVHLAAQAGVRYSLTNPDVYIASNIQGFLNVLEAAKAAAKAATHPVKHLVYASSSSVYGINTVQPFAESNAADHPASLYAVTKRANELMAHSYAHLYNIPTTGLRFFTVYGPWGRPDMAPMLFTKAILSGQPIDVFNHGDMRRDFTYVDDIVEGILRVMRTIPQGDSAWDGVTSGVSPAPARVYNIGNGAPVPLLDFIHALEDELGIKAQMNMLPLQPGDVSATWADCSALQSATGYRPSTPIRKGIKSFVQWYREFYKIDTP